MASSRHALSSMFLLLLLLFTYLSFFQIAAAFGSSDHRRSTKLYIVYLGERKHQDPNLVTASHLDVLSSLLGSKEAALSSMTYSYRHGFSGFAAMLTDSQAEQIAELPEVISVHPNTFSQLHTTRSWDFLGMPDDDKQHPDGLLQKANFGENIIIGVVDTGIWPESRSFDDEGYGPIPSRWKGICQEGQNFSVHDCNRKIIGARWYSGGVDPEVLDVDYKSPRDHNGHGTHTASTAAGSLVSDVGFHGLAVGTARGGAPRARLAIYKACWGDPPGSCGNAAVLKAMDDAIHDGVDILSLSLVGMLNPYFGSINAVAKGITVIFSGGNKGPIPQTISNDLPWVITVAASTIDRSFPTTITLGNNQSVVGQSLYYASEDAGYKELAYLETYGDAPLPKAIDDAIHDGVDILSLSLGGMLNPFFGSIDAVAKGIRVIFSGGNEGPIPQTMSNDLPWVTTSAASTIDRSFPTTITLGNKQRVVGQSLYYASEDAGFKELAFFKTCSADAINSTDITGKIVLCADSLYAAGGVPGGGSAANGYFLKAVYRIEQANGTGVIFGRTPLGLLSGDCDGGFACVLVDNDVLLWIMSYWNISSTSAVVKVRPAVTVVGSGVMSPRVAAFSSRGPSLLYPDLIKPDITAPGVGILAAVGDSYEFKSGTSMSCPHVSGVAALLKAVHPEWSPAAIKSALVTTAYTTNARGFPVEADGIPRKVADPFDFGGGHINPDRAADPGLIYDVDPKDYSRFFRCNGNASTCDLVDSRLYHRNLPSVSISDLKTSVTVWRTVTNVGDTNSTYRAVVEPPPGVNMTVQPSVLQFSALQKVQTFALTFTALEKVQGGFNFGSLTWYDGGSKHAVRIPIAVRIIIQDFFSDTS